MGRRVYTKEVVDFLLKNVDGRTNRQLVQLLNDKFNINATETSIRSYKTAHKIQGKPASRKGINLVYTKEIISFIRENAKGVSNKDMATKVNIKFGTNFTTEQLKGVKNRYHIRSGLNGQFQKDHTPYNKGIKGIHYPGCEKGWFQKGHSPLNTKKVGDEVKDCKDGYTFVKIADPNVWKLKQRLIWEENFGPIPDNCLITFLDGNNENFSLDNLAVITKRENAVLNKKDLRYDNIEETSTGLGIARLMIAIKERNKDR